MKKRRKARFLGIVCYCFTLLSLVSGESVAQAVDRFKDSKTIDDFLQYRSDRKRPFILAHRGGPGASDTENSIPTFNQTASVLPNAILEMDVRITRDSNYVLLHDPTLDRESNATGPVAEWSLPDLKKIFLNDLSGKRTQQRMSTFDEVLDWNKNRYVLALDVKPGTDPIKVMDKVLKHRAEYSVFVICYSVAEAQRMRDRFPLLWLAVGVNSMADLDRFEKEKLPATGRLIALTPQKLQPATFYERLHKLGMLCSVGTYGANQLDEKPLEEAAAGYRELFRQGGDIITTDRPREVAPLF